MQTVDFSVFGNDYWKPEDDKDYFVVFGNPRIERRKFKDDNEEKPVLVLDVFSVGKEVFVKPKEFSTSARTFRDQIRPLIERAVKENRERIRVVLKRKNGKEYTITDYEQLAQIETM